MALAIADRIDSLVGIFSIGQQPSGSKDPFALRRASLGILRIIIEGDLDIDLIDLIHCAEAQYSAVKTRKATGDKLKEQVLTYIMDRFKSWYKDKGHDANRIASVTCLKLSNPLDINARIEAVKKFTLLPDAAVLAAANKRVSNLLNKQLGDKKPHALDLSLLEAPAEKQLAEQMAALSKTIAPMLEQRNYYGALEKLATLRQPVDHFFDQVMVMTDCEKTRNNRLALLQNLRQLFINVADISQLAPTK
jgi:glycyl-tRNA synthetase beta chain